MPRRFFLWPKSRKTPPEGGHFLLDLIFLINSNPFIPECVGVYVQRWHPFGSVSTAMASVWKCGIYKRPETDAERLSSPHHQRSPRSEQICRSSMTPLSLLSGTRSTASSGMGVRASDKSNNKMIPRSAVWVWLMGKIFLYKKYFCTQWDATDVGSQERVVGILTRWPSPLCARCVNTWQGLTGESRIRQTRPDSHRPETSPLPT